VNLVLVGLRASGKSTVGRILSERLGRPFIDTDALVIQQAGQSIRDIFAAEGEAEFRRREREVIQRLTSSDRAVVALGGGALEDERNRAALRPIAHVVWLRASAETLWQRMQADPATTETRPDLTAMGGLEEIRHLLAIREPNFRGLADLIVDTDQRDPADVAEQVGRWWQGVAAARGGSS